MATILVTTMTTGIINPKLYALIMNELPEDKLATINAGMGTIFNIGMVAGQALVPYGDGAFCDKYFSHLPLAFCGTSKLYYSCGS